MANKVILEPDPKLRMSSVEIAGITEDIKLLIKSMRETIFSWEDSRDAEVSVGLAAVQIGELYRVVLIRDSFEDYNNKNFSVLINPKIIKTDGAPIIQYEGCMSVADIYGKVARFPKIRVEALNEDGQKIVFNASGYRARVIQHEVDHTNGILFIDRALKGSGHPFKKMVGDKLINIESYPTN